MKADFIERFVGEKTIAILTKKDLAKLLTEKEIKGFKTVIRLEDGE